MGNRLAGATSPYLLQHQDNPVDWFEWGEEAFEQARNRDVPILLSVGYAACHWCHVMAHESFEDPATAELMNARFVNVKVDREERPDVDAVYMSATHALTGQGGWPMTVFLTQDGAPFFAGTYFPLRPRPGIPAFTQLLGAVAQAWQQRREEVEETGRQVAAVLARRGSGASTTDVTTDVRGASLGAGGEDPSRTTPGEDLVTRAVRALAADEDRLHGGFGGAPKFPPSMDLEFLLRHAARLRLNGPGSAGTGEQALEVATRTLHAMARSGVYDQVAGGFARYAVDRAWVVPHFEKMLYDNAQLASVYLHWWRLTGEPTGARIAEETCDWMLAALRTPQGGLASSLDADTAVAQDDGTVRGVEGLTYVWTPVQLADVLPDPDDAAWAAELLQVTPSGTFEHGSSTLQLARDVWADPDQAARWVRLRGVLALARARRPQPRRDDKVVAAWNGLAIAALAETGALLDRPDLVAAAERVADLLLTVHLDDAPAGAVPSGGRARLRRVSRDGRAGTPAAVLEDYGDVAHGLLVLHAVTGAARWLQAAGALLDTVLTHFVGPGGTLFDTADFATDAALAAIRRPQDPIDGAYPSGNSAAAAALLGHAAATASLRHRDAAESALAAAASLAGGAPRAFGWALATVEALLDGPREVAVVGPPGGQGGPPGGQGGPSGGQGGPSGGQGGPSGGQGGPSGEQGEAHGRLLHRVALAGTAPGLVVSMGEPDAVGVPLLAGRPPVGGVPTAYVCRGFVCDAPTTSAEALAAAVGARLAVVTGTPGVRPQ